MSIIFTLLAVLFLIVVGGSVAYLVTVLIAASIAKRELAGRSLAPMPDGKLPRLAVVIPAHDESAVIGGTLESLLDQDYDRELFEIVVVADNCTDDTADIAREYGVVVFERTDADLRGKGHALNWAIARLLDEVDESTGEAQRIDVSQAGAPSRRFDGFVIVDADTKPAANFLSLMAVRFAAETDPRGYCALQGRYGVLNAADGWRAGLMAGAFELFNHVRPLGRDRLGLTVGLKGNGMAFSRALMCEAQWSGSVTEDIDFALDLCRRYRIRVAYVPEARVDAQMPTTSAAAASQRSRWESGRFQLMRERAIPMLTQGLRQRNVVMIDAAVDLMIPPLAELATFMLIWAVVAGSGAVTGELPHAIAWLDTVAVCSIALFAYIVGGLAVAGASRAAYSALVFAPFYAMWKLCLYASRGHRKRVSGGEWIRTAREPAVNLSLIQQVDELDDAGGTQLSPATSVLQGSEAE